MRRRRRYYDDFNWIDFPKPQRNWNKICGAVFGFFFAIIATLLWIALYSNIYNIDMIFIYLPASTALSQAAFYFYMKEIQDWNFISYFAVIFAVASAIVSIVGWFSSDTDISATSICNTILSAVMFTAMMRNL